jgi:hypothetical protein
MPAEVPQMSLAIDPITDDIQTVASEADDMAWESAVAVSTAGGYSLGSPEFEGVYRRMRTEFEHAVEHVAYFMHCSLLAVKAQLESGRARLVVGEDADPSTVEESLLDLARAVSASLMHNAVLGHDMWLTNDDIERIPVDARAVHFDLSFIYSDSTEEGAQTP